MRVLLASNEMESVLDSLLHEGRIIERQAEVNVVSLSRQNLPAVIYDYDVAIIDHSRDVDVSYLHVLRQNLVQLSNEVRRALSQGRGVVCIAAKEPGEVEGIPRYAWVENGEISLLPSRGMRIQLTKQGARPGIKEYLTHVAEYFAECRTRVDQIHHAALAVIGETNFAVAMEISHPAGGFMVVVPPPSQHDIIALGRLVDLARFYCEKAQRRIVAAEEPSWVEHHKTEEYRKLSTEIQKLEERRQHLETITYLLYGTGDDLVESVRITLSDLGIKVKKTILGANVDLEPEEGTGGVNLFLEVTGSKEPVKKDSNKVAQAMEFIRDHADDPSAKLIVIANAYNHLPLEQRRDKLAFTEPVVRLLEPHGVLMMTTEQLYFLWKDVQEGRRRTEEVRELLRAVTGVLKVS